MHNKLIYLIILLLFVGCSNNTTFPTPDRFIPFKQKSCLEQYSFSGLGYKVSDSIAIYSFSSIDDSTVTLEVCLLHKHLNLEQKKNWSNGFRLLFLDESSMEWDSYTVDLTKSEVIRNFSNRKDENMYNITTQTWSNKVDRVLYYYNNFQYPILPLSPDSITNVIKTKEDALAEVLLLMEEM